MKPVPWFRIIKLVLSTAAVIIWDETHPHAQVWQLALVCVIAIASLEGLHAGYRHEQDRAARRKP